MQLRNYELQVRKHYLAAKTDTWAGVCVGGGVVFEKKEINYSLETLRSL